MKSLTADVVVIGAGSAGLAAYKAASVSGKHVVLVEGGTYGTTCARVGCMPSKLMIAAAEAAHNVSFAPAFGIHTSGLRIDGREVMRRVRQERDRFVGFVLEGIERIATDNKVQGYARFIHPHLLQIDDHTTIQTGQVVIATGSRPSTLPQLHGLGERLLTNEELFEWQDLPKSIAVVGSGVIGLELGQALHRLGVRVVIFGRGSQLSGITDPMVLRTAREVFSAQLDLGKDTRIVHAIRTKYGVALTWTDQDAQEHTDEFSLVLMATGRTPNIESLDLERAGLKCDPDGIPVFDRHTMQCGDSPIFIAGDVSNERPLLHEAADQGRIAGENAGRFPDVRPGLRRAPLAIAFTDPQIAMVGDGFKALAPGRTASGEVSFVDQGRSRVMLKNQGMLRVYGEYASERFLGAELCGPSAEHLAHLMAWALQAEMTVPQMLTMPFYHPVIEEGLRTALRDLQAKLEHGLPAIEQCTDCTPGM